jgi:hypothetical protein
MKKKKRTGAREKITKCVILEPTGEGDLNQIAEEMGARAGSRSLRIRLALRIAAGLTRGEILRALDEYQADTGE